MKKNICFIIESMGGGGAQKNLHRLIKTLQNENVSISLITFKKNEKDRFFFKKISRHYAKVPLHSSNLLMAVINNIKRISILRKLLKNISPSVVVSFLPSTNIISIISTMGLRIKILISERNDPDRQSLKIFWVILRYVFYRFSDLIICNSQNAVKSIQKISGKSNVVYIKNFISQKNTKIKIKRKKILLAVGRLEEQKNFKDLIISFSILNSKMKGYSLYILGEGSQRKMLEDLIKKVYLPGYVNPHPFFNSSELYISSSIYEGVSNATIEAMHYALPIIITKNQEGMNEFLIHNYNSLIIKNSIEDITNSLFSILNSKTLSKRLGLKARETIRKYDDKSTENNWKEFVLD